MGDLTRYFDHADFACPCCGLNCSHPLAVCGAEQVRRRLGRPVFITSATRCWEHNIEEGGAPRSQHLPGALAMSRAVDLVCPGARLQEMLNAAENIEQFRDGGIGLYLDGESRFMHADVRTTGRARWYQLDGVLVEVSELLRADAERPVEGVA